MKRVDKEKCKQILFACAQMLGTLELKMSLKEAETLLQVKDGIAVVHSKLIEEEKKS